MTFLNAWVLFALIPLALLYKRHALSRSDWQIRLFYLTLVMGILALSRPALKTGLVKERFDAQDYIIALDASYSMQATDLAPTRYEAAKAAIAKLLQLHPKDRFTLFAFTSNALLISPPTSDTAVSLNALEALNPEYILTKSTSLYALLESVSKMSLAKKKLILFTDGGDEHDLSRLLTLAKRHHITIFAVATATSGGAALRHDGKYLRKHDGSLVISKINPILEPLARNSGGDYFSLASGGAVDALSDAIGSQQEDSREETIEVQRYQELFYLPLFLALLGFFLAVTRLHRRLLPLLLLPLLLPSSIRAGMLDAYHLSKAYDAYNSERYETAARYFEQITPTPQTYYNSAVALYKAGRFALAYKRFASIKTPNAGLKQSIYYNMGNCAAKLGRFAIAENNYIKALALGKDDDARYNLELVRDLRLRKKKSVTPTPPSKTKKASEAQEKKTQKQQQNKKNAAGSNADRQASQSTSGQGGEKQKKKAPGIKNRGKKQPGEYRLGYRAYERINKGYADEKEPW